MSGRIVPGSILAIAAVFAGAIMMAPGCGISDSGVPITSAGDGGAVDDGYGPSPEDGGISLDTGGAPGDDAALSDSPWFDDGAAKDVNQPGKYVSLKTAGSFVVLAGETVTNTGFTIINGDVGIHPGSAITGFPPGIVNGVIHLTDAAAAQAKIDLNGARDEAIAMSGPPNPLVGDLGGMTLTRGLYQSSDQMLVSSADLTLDAQGDQNAVWVFQIQTTFVIMVGRKVTLINNAKPDNVFWNVGSSATIGVGSFMVGNFLTQTSITVQTGATMDGRFLTQTGSVTFDSNNINRPPPIIH